MGKMSFAGGGVSATPSKEDIVKLALIGEMKDVTIETTGSNTVENGHILQYNADATPSARWENSNVIDGGTY